MFIVEFLGTGLRSADEATSSDANIIDKTLSAKVNYLSAYVFDGTVRFLNPHAENGLSAS
jgi:hypothetical protein